MEIRRLGGFTLPWERQGRFLRDVTGFWEVARVLSFDFGARSFPPMTRKGNTEDDVVTGMSL